MKRELHLISNGKMSFSELLRTIEGIRDIDYIHIRERDKSAKEIYEGMQLLLDGGFSPSQLVVNDRVDVALCTGISRVQLGYRSLHIGIVKEKFPHLHVGCSVHSLEEAEQAKREGADSILYGHIFATRSKEGLMPRGMEAMREIVRVGLPVIAIGGITPENAAPVLSMGATGIAIMSGLLEAPNPKEEAKRYRETMRRRKNNG